MKTSILITWAVVLIVVGSLTITSFEIKSAGIIRLLTPVIGLVTTYLIEYLYKKEETQIKTTTILRLLAIPFLVLGFNWLCIFSLTEYREHHRVIILPLSIFFVSLGLLLTHYNLIKK